MGAATFSISFMGLRLHVVTQEKQGETTRSHKAKKENADTIFSCTTQGLRLIASTQRNKIGQERKGVETSHMQIMNNTTNAANQIIFTNDIDFRVTLDGRAVVALETRPNSFTPWKAASLPLGEDDFEALNLEIFRLNNGLTEREARAQYGRAA